MQNHFVLMASYNAWMNERVYAVSSELSAAELAEQRGAYFGSVLGTLNHLLVGDRIWLHRFADHPARPIALELVRQLPKPKSLDEMLYTDFVELREHRNRVDRAISEWAGALTAADLDHVLRYSNTKGVVAAKQFSSLVMHFFNHQTHHRGQVTTLLSQFGKDIGVTDLLMLIPNEERQ